MVVIWTSFLRIISSRPPSVVSSRPLLSFRAKREILAQPERFLSRKAPSKRHECRGVFLSVGLHSFEMIRFRHPGSIAAFESTYLLDDADLIPTEISTTAIILATHLSRRRPERAAGAFWNRGQQRRVQNKPHEIPKPAKGRLMRLGEFETYSMGYACTQSTAPISTFLSFP